MTPTRRPRRRRWLKLAAALLLGPLLVLGAVFFWLYRSVAVEVDARLAGLHERVAPKVYARPFVLRTGQALTAAELDDRLDDLGYTRKARASEPGEFDVRPSEVRLVPRGGTAEGQVVRVGADARCLGTDRTGLGRSRCGPGAVAQVQLEAPLLTAVAPGGRGRQRQLPLAQLPPPVVQAVLAIEDRRFYSHPGVDVIRTVGAVVTNLRGDKPYLVGGSTLTQQLVKNSFLTPEKTYTRKVREQVMSIVVERRLTKDQILELYLNDVYLGQRGSFSVHGVAEGAHLYFGKDVSNVSLGEAAMLAGIIQSPAAYSPTRHPVRARERRDVVLRAMVEAGYVTREAAEAAIREPLQTAQGSVDAEAPYFVDHVTQLVGEQVAMRASATRVAVHTTLDLHLQRVAQDVVATGVADIEARFAKRGTETGARCRPRSWPSIREPATSSRWSAAGRTSGRSTTGRPRPSVSRARPSSPSCSCRRSTRHCGRAGPTSRRRPSSRTSPPPFWSTARSGHRATTTGSTTASSRRAAPSPGRATWRPSRWRNSPATTTSPRSGAA